MRTTSAYAQGMRRSKRHGQGQRTEQPKPKAAPRYTHRQSKRQFAEVFELGGKAALSLVPRRSSSAICSALSSFASGGT